MFQGTGAESLCAKQGASNGYATEGGASTNLAPVAGPQPQSARTITARDVPFPLVDPYSPVDRAGIPVPGYNVWPRRANRLGRRYYGLTGDEAKVSTKAKQAIEKAFAKPEGFGGLGAFEPGWESIYGLPATPPVMTPPISGASSRGFNWNNLFAGIFNTLPATVSAIKGTGVPTGYYGSGYLAPSQGYYNPNVIPVAPGSGVGIGVDSQGVRLSDGSHIGWLPIAAVVGGFMLLQSKGFSRR